MIPEDEGRQKPKKCCKLPFMFCVKGIPVQKKEFLVERISRENSPMRNRAGSNPAVVINGILSVRTIWPSG